MGSHSHRSTPQISTRVAQICRETRRFPSPCHFVTQPSVPDSQYHRSGCSRWMQSSGVGLLLPDAQDRFSFLLFSYSVTVRYLARCDGRGDMGVAGDGGGAGVDILQSIFTAKKPWKFQDELRNKFDDARMCGFYEFFKPTLLVWDTEILKHIFVKDFDYFVDHRHFDMKTVHERDLVMMEMLSAVNGAQWKSLRAIMSPAFTSGKIKSMFHLVLLKALHVSINPPELDFFVDVVKHTVAAREAGKTRGDFLDLLLEARDNSDNPNSKLVLSQRSLIAQSVLFIIAGYETTASLLDFSSFLLAKHKNQQQRLREEVRQLVKKYGGITYHGIMEGKLLKACLQETLRLYPPALFMERYCTKAYKLPGTDLTIRPGDIVQAPIWALHHDPRHWPDPEAFIPDRFLPENKRQHQFLRTHALWDGTKELLSHAVCSDGGQGGAGQAVAGGRAGVGTGSRGDGLRLARWSVKV
ncbi:hypothetical protein O3P69_020822 [Scylla paramamosain]|uniref:Cytochrome P450 n=1 Tax=Scylla paramamosain TaxID=85552 RepID=A0AAW0TNM1_SCYPA